MTSGLREAWKPPASEDNEYVYKLTAEDYNSIIHLLSIPTLPLSIQVGSSPGCVTLHDQRGS